MPTVLVVLAQGFEEMEAVAPIDLLRRAEAEVTVAGLTERELIGRSGLHLTTELVLEEVESKTFDLIVLPGGPAFKLLRKDLRLRAMLQKHARENKTLAAICAAPTVLFDAGLLEGRAYTAHFTVCDELTAIDPTKAVVQDGQIITSQGAGTATPFALALVTHLFGKEKAAALSASICYEVTL